MVMMMMMTMINDYLSVWGENYCVFVDDGDDDDGDDDDDDDDGDDADDDDGQVEGARGGAGWASLQNGHWKEVQGYSR